MSNSDRYGFIGLGVMGHHMATNLQTYVSSQNLAPLIVYNRTFSKTQALTEIGAIAAKSLKEVVEYANIIFTSLANDDTVNQIYETLLKEHDQIAGDNKRKVIFVDTSTIYPTTIAAIQEKLENVENRYLLHCPVVGPPVNAKAARLIIVTSGNQAAIDHVNHLLVPVLGRKTMHVGTDVRKAASFKLTVNFFIGSTLEALSEGMTLAEKNGIEREKLLETINLLFPDSPYGNYGTKILKENFKQDIGFNIDNALKDVNHIRRLAKDSETHLPSADLFHKHLSYAKEHLPDADQDWSCVVGSVRLQDYHLLVENQKNNRWRAFFEIILQ
ncbi:13383_t:CDS:2 [Acaulospora morrowiae]|uniref:13383_t:CDS:1 n=1 Tax=Acaulospora morrowiae TaxID=94023 RepID=A0A9N9C972_9GLOM|nr:13383_t:CDS:2 [Acaulospora morrowiae]